MFKLIVASLVLASVAHAGIDETWSVDGKVFKSKAVAIQYIVATGKRVEVVHTQCQILSNKMSFKNCPKVHGWDNEEFRGLSKGE